MSVVEAGNASQSVMEQVGPNIIHHVSNSDISHPILGLPTFFGIDFSITKHVFMLWVVAFLVAITIIIPIRKFLSSGRPTPSGWMNAIEAIVQFIRDSIAKPNVGPKWVMTWTPLLLTLFFFILFANGIGMVPIFDVLGLFNRFVMGVPASDTHNFINNILHGGVTATGNFNMTAALAVITFFAIIIAGIMEHGFFKHWKNMVPGDVPKAVLIILIPIEIMSMFVRPFALTMRLAANMTAGHIAMLAIFAPIFILHNIYIGIGSVALNVGITFLEIIVSIVQAYVFTLLSSVFIGQSIHPNH